MATTYASCVCVHVMLCDALAPIACCVTRVCVFAQCMAVHGSGALYCVLLMLICCANICTLMHIFAAWSLSDNQAYGIFVWRIWLAMIKLRNYTSANHRNVSREGAIGGIVTPIEIRYDRWMPGCSWNGYAVQHYFALSYGSVALRLGAWLTKFVCIRF